MMEWFWKEDGEFLIVLTFFWFVIPATIYLLTKLAPQKRSARY